MTTIDVAAPRITLDQLAEELGHPIRGIAVDPIDLAGEPTGTGTVEWWCAGCLAGRYFSRRDDGRWVAWGARTHYCVGDGELVETPFDLLGLVASTEPVAGDVCRGAGGGHTEYEYVAVDEDGKEVADVDVTEELFRAVPDSGGARTVDAHGWPTTSASGQTFPPLRRVWITERRYAMVYDGAEWCYTPSEG